MNLNWVHADPNPEPEVQVQLGETVSPRSNGRELSSPRNQGSQFHILAELDLNLEAEENPGGEHDIEGATAGGNMVEKENVPPAAYTWVGQTDNGPAHGRKKWPVTSQHTNRVGLVLVAHQQTTTRSNGVEPTQSRSNANARLVFDPNLVRGHLASNRIEIRPDSLSRPVATMRSPESQHLDCRNATPRDRINLVSNPGRGDQPPDGLHQPRTAPVRRLPPIEDFEESTSFERENNSSDHALDMNMALEGMNSLP
ncbi:hypothetical protein Cgig2_032097 [Carnegiea gigantea]|uniref:Uncharacterized protein n=1 Tax=Carnegiea gigantea TaxID=171969 RepID=A0A9Q1GMT1_9CARY|nr:hypothetical protein Cgig2_032097 [Carnegiea gigantea]